MNSNASCSSSVNSGCQKSMISTYRSSSLSLPDRGTVGDKGVRVIQNEIEFGSEKEIGLKVRLMVKVGSVVAAITA